ncbi:hypothetical protein [Candidimonas nitroreducens]|nr:hypothetical protein [Candidimonas nitroreducens]
MSLDLTKLAQQMRQCDEQGKPCRLPAMTVRELGILARLLHGPAASTLIH